MSKFSRISLDYIHVEGVSPKIQGLDRIAQIAEFNSTMSARDVIKLQNRTAIGNMTDGPEKNEQIETFINQLYGLIEIKKAQERKNY